VCLKKKPGVGVKWVLLGEKKTLERKSASNSKRGKLPYARGSPQKGKVGRQRQKLLLDYVPLRLERVTMCYMKKCRQIKSGGTGV